MMKTFLSISFIFASSIVLAQVKPDSTRKLNEVVIKPYFSNQSLLRATGSIGLVNYETFQNQSSGSFVSALNTISGVRMEERSPGSYRLSLRGSLLRSPFGIRNVKIYMDDFPLTDAGGNTYLNALDVAGTAQIEILKGPHGNIFGANSGGVLLIRPKESQNDHTSIELKAEGGSFGTFHQDITLQHQAGNYGLNITQAYQRSDGYRDHSAMNRKYFQIYQKLDYAAHASFRSLIFYSDLHYDTPGALTLAQYEANPKSSRPAAGPSKSAIEQQAGIYSKTLYGGVAHDWKITKDFKHVIAAFTSYTNFKNPFISNYEKRDEHTLGLRSYLEYVTVGEVANWKFNLGVESMQTSTNFDNYDNNGGKFGKNQASDDLKAFSNFAFLHVSADFSERLLLELSASANFYRYGYKSIFPIAIPYKTNRFGLQIMPRAAISYLATDYISLRASASKGYSPPTLAEVRASDNVINVDLEPEHGWNYEAGVRIQSLNKRLLLDLTGFSYHLKSAIVRRLNGDNTEYFVNAGGTKQLGLESALSLAIIPAKNSGVIRSLKLNTAYTLSLFRFRDYLNDSNDYSGNRLTGVPKTTLINSLDLHIPAGMYLFVQHNFTSRIPLNDANSIYAKSYQLVQAKAGIKKLKIRGTTLGFFGGVDNLLDQKYSLGNDLNAFGGRYFNASAGRNYYAGMELSF